jgi:peptide/nickel transport system permease protein
MTPIRSIIRRRRHPGALAGAFLLSLVLLPAFAAPLLPLPDPTLTAPAARMLPPLSSGHLFGTDQLGRDLLSRLIWGARSSVVVGLAATLSAALVGALLGIAAGWLGRVTDAVLMRGVDVLMAFPYLLLALAIVAALGPGLLNAMFAIAVANVPFFARAVRAAVLDLRHRDYVAAARLAGLGELRIVVTEILPNLAPVVLVLMTTTLGWMVLETAGLSFLGLGAQPPQADLGSMLGEGRAFLTTYPQVAVLPGLVILLIVIGINLLGDALRDLIDPRFAGSGGLPRTTRGIGASGRPAMSPAASAGAHAGDAARPVPLLSVRGLTVRFPGEIFSERGIGAPPAADAGTFDVVSGVDFDLERGERVALVGESGSGKTLTALALMRLVPAPGWVRGSVRLDGDELTALDAAAMRELRGRRIAYVPQQPLTALDPLFRIGQQIDEALRAHTSDPAAPEHVDRLRVDRLPVDQLLELVGLDRVPDLRRRYPHQLSGGQRQRVAIAMALLHRPALLIADEATTALDVTVQREVLELLRRLSAEQGSALLFVSHDLALVGGLCSRVLVMYAGRVVEDASVDVLLSRPAHPYSSALLACSPELGRPDKPLPAISGQPPAPGERPIGCRFADRCPRVQSACRLVEPALKVVGCGHRVRCYFPLPDSTAA